MAVDSPNTPREASCSLPRGQARRMRACLRAGIPLRAGRCVRRVIRYRQPHVGPAPQAVGDVGLAAVRPGIEPIAERQAIETALRDCDGSREKAADMLGISATTLWRKMTRLGISFDPR